MVKRLDRETSDHYPIQLSMGINQWGPPPFRFDNAWMQLSSFLPLIEHWWKITPLHGWPGHGFIQKLKSFKGIIRSWKGETYGCNSRQKQQLLSELAILDSLEEEGSIQAVQISQRNSLKAQLLSIAIAEEAHWRQRCKLKWLQEGDMNTGFFHRVVAARRRKSSIFEILSRDGRSLIEDADIETEFVSFYETLYTKKISVRQLPASLSWAPITQLQRDLLEAPFIEAEISFAVKDLETNKTPGPDGFTAEFYKKYWNILKHDILKVFQDFFRKGIINASLNETYICLIPKKMDARTVSDYRPISLISCMYKIIARVLSERLKKVLPHTITEFQSAFVAKRQILDASLIANEIIDGWEKKQEKGVVIKLDIEKAFDKSRLG